jgi:rubrerythrin
MNLDSFSIEELLLAALKSEIESREVYLSLMERVKNAFLKDKLKFLADEEEKHRKFVESVFRKEFGEKEITIPEESPVPLPVIKIDGTIGEAIGTAMDAEKAAYDFYLSLSEKFPQDIPTKKTLSYLATMEMGHYRLLELEKETMEKYEDYDTEWPMIHVGP